MDQCDEKYERLKQIALPLPKNTFKFQFQAGGHGVIKKKIGLLTDSDEVLVYKYFRKLPKCLSEVDFYTKTINDTQKLNGDFKKYIPKFVGIFYESETNHIFLGLENFLHSMKKPNVCDIKIGKISYAPGSSQDKIKAQQNKYLYRKDIGFMITGMILYNKDTCAFDHVGSQITKEFTPATIIRDGFQKFFNRLKTENLINAIDYFNKQLVSLLEWFKSQKAINFRSSSLIFAYDDTGVDHSYEFRMVDFSHWFYSDDDEKDLNFIEGLESLKDYLSKLY